MGLDVIVVVVVVIDFVKNCGILVESSELVCVGVDVCGWWFLYILLVWGWCWCCMVWWFFDVLVGEKVFFEFDKGV